MATIDDIGGPGQSLASFGGPAGWAAAVRDELHALQAGIPDDPGPLWGRWQGTQAEYDALGSYDPTTLYVIIAP